MKRMDGIDERIQALSDKAQKDKKGSVLTVYFHFVLENVCTVVVCF